MNKLLAIKNLEAIVDDQRILNGLNLDIKPGEVHVIMGPNGSGKSTMANVLLGNPKFQIKAGEIIFKNKNINNFKPEDRVSLGMFLAWQYPREIAGVTLDQFLFLAYKNIMMARDKNWVAPSVFEFKEKLQNEAKKLSLPLEFLERNLNVGFSGGEKKKTEMLQLAILEPSLIILDETDSGLDVDALKIVGEAVKNYQTKDRGVLLITHYDRILKYISPNYIHIMVNGQLIKSGDKKLAQEIEKQGYQQYVKKA